MECSFGCVPSSAVLLKPNVVNILLFNFCEQKFVQHGPITIAIDCNGLSLLIFEEKLPNYVSGPKSALNSDSFWVRRLSMYAAGGSVSQMRQFCLITFPPRSKWASSEKTIFFSKIGIFYKSIAGLLSEAYTQPYSLGGRMKLIICKFKHELSVTIQEISTSKKDIRWRSL